MNNSLPELIIDFLEENRALSIACSDGLSLWAANCFYALDPEMAALIVLSSRESRHGRYMHKQPQIAGTVSFQPQSIAEIRGIQFSARAQWIDPADPRRRDYRRRYVRRHPAARMMDSDLWLLHLDCVKYTDNRQIFARKTLWQRQDNQEP